MLTTENAIKKFKELLSEYKDLVKALEGYEFKEDGCIDFSTYIVPAYIICEYAAKIFLLERGYLFDDSGVMINNDILNRHSMGRYDAIAYILHSAKEQMLPKQCMDLIRKLKDYRNQAVHGMRISREVLVVFLHAFKNFIYWFLLENSLINQVDENSFDIRERFYQLEENIGYIFKDEEKNIALDSASTMNEKLDRLLSGQEDIKKKLNSIEHKIEELSEQITGYQSLIERQLEMADTEEEVERIIHTFTEECIEKIVSKMNGNYNQNTYDIELSKVKSSLGENAWNKLDASSRTFLVSSKVMFNNLLTLNDIIDYSGVCLLVTKALEVEMSKRFCKNFLAYLKIKYPGKSGISKYPTALLDRYGKPIKPKHFTLGTVAYALCYMEPVGVEEEQLENNREILLEYCRNELFSGKTDNEIMEMLTVYAVNIEDIKNEYRNPSAHTNELKKVNAEECFNLVLDVEKLLKKMLNSFDK